MSKVSVIPCSRIFRVVAAFLLISLVTLPHAQGNEIEEGKVVQLTDKTFEHLTQASTGMTTGSWFIKFYASWCGHCKSMAAGYDLLAMDEELIAKGIVLGKVEVPDHREVGKRFGIKGFPTLIFLHRSKMYRYSGARSVDSMKKFLLSEYEKVDGLPIPQPPTAMDQLMETAKQIYGEVKDAVNGKAGKGTQWAFILTGVLFIMTLASLLLVIFMPVKKYTAPSGTTASKESKPAETPPEKEKDAVTKKTE